MRPEVHSTFGRSGQTKSQRSLAHLSQIAPGGSWEAALISCRANAQWALVTPWRSLARTGLLDRGSLGVLGLRPDALLFFAFSTYTGA